MNEKQKKVIGTYRAEFNKNLAEFQGYNPEDVCSFHVYAGSNDDNICIVSSYIQDIIDFQLKTKYIYIMVQPDGNAINLIDLYPQGRIIEYINSLKKID